MSKSAGSLRRGRRLRHEVPDVPPAADLTEPDRHAQAVLRRLVERAGGRFGRGSPIPTDAVDVVADLFDRWARRHAARTADGWYFNGRPGLWHALDELYPLEDPNRWDQLRLAAIQQLEREGWVRRSPPRGAGFDLPEEP